MEPFTGEELYFKLVDGYTLYDLDISFAGPNSYTINNQLPAIGVIDNFVCSQEDILEDIFGCMDMSAINYNADATVDDGSCDFEIFSCMDMSAINYNADATVDDGSCDFEIFGCMDMSAINYNADATVDDGSCDFEIFGCMDMSAINYNADATVDDGSCDFEIFGCTKSL